MHLLRDARLSTVSSAQRPKLQPPTRAEYDLNRPRIFVNHPPILCACDHFKLDASGSSNPAIGTTKYSIGANTKAKGRQWLGLGGSGGSGGSGLALVAVAWPWVTCSPP